MNLEILHRLGWETSFSLQLEGPDDFLLKPCRIIAEQKIMYLAASEFGELSVSFPGRLRNRTAETEFRPTVGDWVLVDVGDGAGQGVIRKILERKSVVIRGQVDSNRRATVEAGRQVLAANVDTVFVTDSLTGLSPNRIERYLALAHEGGAWPVVLLTKADLCDEPEAVVAELQRRMPMVDIIPVSAREGQGMERLDDYLGAGRTVVLLGPSGVGKSTLVNSLLGEDVQAVGSVRAMDDKGRHTTTARQMFRLPRGALVIDTPGLRAVGLAEGPSGVNLTFEDVMLLAVDCRFRNCSHDGEPGCAVVAAVEDGRLDKERYANYLNLKREAERSGVRGDPLARKRENRRMGRMIAEVKQMDKRKFSR